MGLGAQAQRVEVVLANLCGVSVGNVAILAALVAQNQQPRTIREIQQGDQTVPVTIWSA